MNQAKAAARCLKKGFQRGTSREPKATGRVMATMVSKPFSTPARHARHDSGAFGEFRAFWRQFFVRAFDPYRPELHYMRGPGPACRAKQRALSPAVRSAAAEIRAAKMPKAPAHS